MAKVLTNDTFNSEVLKSKKACLVDFYADWCGPCKMMSPIIEELAQQYGSKLGDYKLDVDKSGELASKYGIASIPALLFFKNGEIAENIVGATAKEILEDKINSYLENA